MRRIIFSMAFLVTACGCSAAIAADHTTAVATVQDFYRRYLSFDYFKTPKTTRPTLRFSRAFLQEVDRTAAVCKKHEEGPCGWGADGDEYLDSQEVDPALTYANSEISIVATAIGRVRVQLDVYPSAKDAGDYYRKVITYKMVRERGSYVVDDVAYSDGISMRKKLVNERDQIIESARWLNANKPK